MKVAIIGSRGLVVPDLEEFIPCETTEIISGGARGVDICAREYALSHGICLVEFLPEYDKFGRRAPLVRNLDIMIAPIWFWHFGTGSHAVRAL